MKTKMNECICIHFTHINTFDCYSYKWIAFTIREQKKTIGKLANDEKIKVSEKWNKQAKKKHGI